METKASGRCYRMGAWIRKNPVLFWSLVAVLAVWVFWVVSVALKAGFWEGTSGDTFGSLTALFTGLAFALLIWTALMQKEELGEQRKQLELQSAEMKSSGIALRNQILESTIRTTLSTYLDVLEAVRVNPRTSMEKRGRGAIKDLADQLCTRPMPNSWLRRELEYSGAMEAVSTIIAAMHVVHGSCTQSYVEGETWAADIYQKNASRLIYSVISRDMAVVILTMHWLGEIDMPDSFRGLRESIEEDHWLEKVGWNERAHDNIED